MQQYISDLNEIITYLKDATHIAVDIETTGLDFAADRLTTISMAVEVGDEIKGFLIDLDEGCSIEDMRAALCPIFRDKNKVFIFHNASFDVRFLYKYQIFFHGTIADTMVMAWLNDEDRRRHGGYGLKHCVLKHLNYRMASYDEARSLFGSFDDYAADDAIQTYRLFKLFLEQLKKDKVDKWFWEVECEVTRLLVETETRGVALDKSKLKQLRRQAYEEISKIEKQIFKEVGYKFDVSSPAQVARVLFDEMKLGAINEYVNKYTERGKPKPDGSPGPWSTSNEVLEAMKRDEIKLAQMLLSYREIKTRLNVFIQPLLERCRETNIIHPRFIQVGTKSGRFASRDPNYQNLPRKGGIREAFVARPGYKILKCDYSQAELRLMAHMSRDPNMVSIYRDNGDIHQLTADSCGISRQAAKACNFGIVYRMSANRLQAQLALGGIIISTEEAKEYIRKYFITYPNVKKYHKLVERVVLERLSQDGYGWIRTIAGRLRRLDAEFLTGEHQYSAITQAINSTIQGGVSDLIKVAMVNCQKAFREKGWLDPENHVWDAYIQGQVHDEIFAECKEKIAPEVAHIISREMVKAGEQYGICVPMAADADIVDNLSKG